VNAWGDKWRAMGYRVAIQRDGDVLPDFRVLLKNAAGDQSESQPRADLVLLARYEGYAKAVNRLVHIVLSEDPACEWIVIGGDDVFPDPTKRADEIALECRKHFYEAISSVYPLHRPIWAQRRWCPEMLKDAHLRPDCDAWALNGVMQPTGDRWGADEAWARQQFPDRPAYIDRVAGSAWIGREFAQRAYGGNGPLWSEYKHMFVDEELQCVAEQLGVFWQRRDLAQHHAHWGRDGFTHAAPDFLREANSGGHWAKYEALFRERKAAGFPGSEAL
jgi:hypothetical protein